MNPGGHESGDVGDIGHQIRANLVGDLTELGEVDHTGIRAEAANDQLGFAFQRSLPDMVHVEQFGVGIQDVIVNFKECSREVWLQAVRQVSTVRDGQTQDPVAGLEQSHKSRDVCVGPAVRLHVGKLTAEQFLRSITSKVFDLVVEFTTAVVPLAGIAFRVLVGQPRSSGFHHGLGGVIFTGNKFKR